MTNDEGDILELLLLEIDFFRKEGCVRLLDTPWLLKSLFQDSLIHLDHGYVRQIRPCGECQRFNLVSPSHNIDDVPCHHNFLNDAGVKFERWDDGYSPAGFENVVMNWLRARITKIKSTSH
jgi:hypothetical protein